MRRPFCLEELVVTDSRTLFSVWDTTVVLEPTSPLWVRIRVLQMQWRAAHREEAPPKGTGYSVSRAPYSVLVPDSRLGSSKVGLVAAIEASSLQIRT